jgi:hypothetical protein
MEFYFPDSQDQINPAYDFVAEEHSLFHVRQRDDRYAHEIHHAPPYSGVLVSKTMVDGYGKGGRYTSAQRHRLYRLGVRRFFRLPDELKAFGDCGAFSYVDEHEPPITVEEVVEFYGTCGFDIGISVDHVILAYSAEADNGTAEVDDDWHVRQQLTLDLAKQFLEVRQRSGYRFTPYGVAQGWSPKSYAYAVERLQELGFTRIALGGMVPLRTMQIVDCLQAIQKIRKRGVALHLLGVTRTDHVGVFGSYGVTSFDSTSPFRQAFKDDKDNYYVDDDVKLVALRVPPSDGNARLQARIQAGQLDQREVRAAEREALRALRAYDAGQAPYGPALEALQAYERLHDPLRAGRRTQRYREMLELAPWKRCPCAVCQRWGIEVAIFRGTERNKRRGFHNIWVFNQTLQAQLAGLNAGPNREGRDRESAA